MIDLYSWGTPNGWKVSIALEELALPYQLHPINLAKREQTSESFLTLNPNGRIPVIVDRDEDDLVIFESGAILIYLAEKTGRLIPDSVHKRSEVLQWLMFQMSGIGPMLGQLGVFKHFLEQKIPIAINRYEKESRRLFEVLNRQLEDRDYLCGEFSIADIAIWPWIQTQDMLEINIDDLPHLSAWNRRLSERPAFVEGMKKPARQKIELPTAKTPDPIVIQ